MRKILETVVSEGGGKKHRSKDTGSEERQRPARQPPRSANRYIGSFIGFAPAGDPQVATMAIIYNPQGIYYGGTIARSGCARYFSTIFFPILESNGKKTREAVEKTGQIHYTKA